MVTKTIRQYPSMYSADFLGEDPAAYCAFITNPEKWGGEIEMSILSQYFEVEIAAVEVSTTNFFIYGQVYY